MEYPPIGLVVKVVLNTGEEKYGYWTGTTWMEGVDNDPIDIEINENVISWRE
jgi:hypothetical protein